MPHALNKRAIKMRKPGDDAEITPDAILIAAAPKMLAALQFYAAHMKLGYEITDSGQVAEEAIREALWQNAESIHPESKP